MSIEYRVPLPVELRNVGSFECLKSQLLTIDIYGGSLQVDRKFIAVQGLEEKWRKNGDPWSTQQVVGVWRRCLTKIWSAYTHTEPALTPRKISECRTLHIRVLIDSHQKFPLVTQIQKKVYTFFKSLQNFHENQRSTKISTTASKCPHFVEISTLVATLHRTCNSTLANLIISHSSSSFYTPPPTTTRARGIFRQIQDCSSPGHVILLKPINSWQFNEVEGYKWRKVGNWVNADFPLEKSWKRTTFPTPIQGFLFGRNRMVFVCKFAGNEHGW